MSPLPGHSALRRHSSEGMIAGRPVTHPLKPWGRLREERRAGGKGGQKRVGKPPDTCPLSRLTPSSLKITILSFSLPRSSPVAAYLSAGDEVRLVGRVEPRGEQVPHLLMPQRSVTEPGVPRRLRLPSCEIPGLRLQEV